MILKTSFLRDNETHDRRILETIVSQKPLNSFKVELRDHANGGRHSNGTLSLQLLIFRQGTRCEPQASRSWMAAYSICFTK